MTTRGDAVEWHIGADLFDDYQRGGLTPSRMLAVEAHLQACAGCRAAVPQDPGWLDESWSGIAARLDDPRVDLSHHRVRVLIAAPALRWSWLGATVAVLTFGIAAAVAGQSAARTTLLLYLVCAPILPVLAVATVYGPPIDPMHEITSATPMAGPSLVLWRSTAVVGLSVVIGLLGALLLPGPGWWAVAWLLPALLLCVSTLALATAMPLVRAAAVFGSAWLVVVGAAAVAGSPVRPLMFGPSAQAGYLATALAAGAVLFARRRRLDPGEKR
jgi:hypothetical protein